MFDMSVIFILVLLVADKGDINEEPVRMVVCCLVYLSLSTTKLRAQRKGNSRDPTTTILMKF